MSESCQFNKAGKKSFLIYSMFKFCTGARDYLGKNVRRGASKNAFPNGVWERGKL